ncbi:hypothetical protein ES703_90924 [subsurface metagenome]
MGAEADEAQTCTHQDGRANIQCTLHQHGREDVGQNMTPDNGQVFHTYAARRLDERALAQGNRLGPHQPRIPRPPGEGNGEHRVDKARPKSSSDGYRQQQRGESQEDIRHTHNYFVNPAAEEPGQGAQRRTDEHGDHDDEQADGQRGARPEHHPGQQISAQAICAKGVCLTGRQEFISEVGFAQPLVCIWRESGCKKRDQYEQYNKHQADHRKAIFPEEPYGRARLYARESPVSK